MNLWYEMVDNALVVMLDIIKDDPLNLGLMLSFRNAADVVMWCHCLELFLASCHPRAGIIHKLVSVEKASVADGSPPAKKVSCLN